MKKSFLTTVVLLFLSSVVFAQSPRLLNLQSMVYDENGVLTTSETVNVTVQVLDATSNLLYEETHTNVPVVEGAINLSVGDQAGADGLPLDAFDPSLGQRYINVLVNGTASYDLLPLTDVASALWARKALTVADDSIESRHIKDGTIRLEDLEEGLTFTQITGTASESQIPSTIVRDSDLTSHTGSTSAHPASSITTLNNFSNFSAGD
ncbi:MAG: hypothetical protein Q7S00_01875, partial [bacterium]|nr:hypothetical protein [bacterium]